MKKISFGLLMLTLLAFSFFSCSDKVDESNIYVFNGKSIADYIKEDPDLSYYYFMLQHAKSGKKGSTMDHLLEARGNYTVFVPTNNAVQHYLDSIFSTPNYDINQTPDSVAQDIVFNSIIDSEHNEAYKTTSFQEGTIDYKTMADRFATVTFGTNDTTGKVRIFIDAFSEITSADNEAENGWMHVVNRVVMPYSSTLPDLIAGQDNLLIFSHLLFTTNWKDSLQAIRDEEYEKRDLPDYDNSVTIRGRVPQHRYFGFTAFVEPDSVLCEKWGVEIKKENGIVTNWDEIMDKVKTICQSYYPNATNPDLTSPDNAVNQFVAYHIVKGSMAYNKLVIHYNEVGYAYTNPLKLGIDKMQYWETMGKYPRLLKMTEGKQTDGKRLNRYVAKYDWDSYDELDVPRPGVLVLPNNGVRDIQALNGFYYPIDDVLWYDEDVPGKVLNERIRFDVLAIQPELMTNGMRALPNSNYYHIYNGYCEGITFTDETDLSLMEVYGISNCRAYEQDEPQFEGDYDVTFKLPHVPNEGTYELRVAVANGPSRGMMQVYVGTDKNNLAAIGLPIDMRYDENTERIGWFRDTEDKEENTRKERNMRNHDVMKGPKCYGSISSAGTTSGRDDGFALHKLRHIIFRGYVSPTQTYYVRFKDVLTNPAANLDIDYFEWVPKNVYAGVEAEDYW
ncbi:MAG: fasciclin domain-containing protein [Bacteroidaceae bacterium]